VCVCVCDGDGVLDDVFEGECVMVPALILQLLVLHWKHCTHTCMLVTSCLYLFLGLGGFSPSLDVYPTFVSIQGEMWKEGVHAIRSIQLGGYKQPSHTTQAHSRKHRHHTVNTNHCHPHTCPMVSVLVAVSATAAAAATSAWECVCGYRKNKS